MTSFYANRKMCQIGYSDANFIKILEKCLRFGLPILIHNVEKLDPILNSLLNKEVIKQGGRSLV